MKKIIDGDKLTANPKPRLKNNPVKYLLGKVLPSVFGMPLHVRVVLRDALGNIKATRSVYNTVTTNGKAGIADQILAAPSLNKPTHMAIGTGSPAANALGTELDRNALTSKTRSGAVVTMQGDWAAADGTGAITEAGVFDASSAGNAWLTTSFSVINKAAADALSISWTLTIA